LLQLLLAAIAAAVAAAAVLVDHVFAGKTREQKEEG